MRAGENEKVGVKWYGMAATIMARMTYLVIGHWSLTSDQ